MLTTRISSKMAAVALAFAGLSHAQSTAADCVEGVDWVKRTVCAKGIGAVNPKMPASAARPGAIRAAQMSSLRNALELVKGLSINSTTTIANSMTQSDEVRSRVEGFIKTFKIGREHYMDDLTVEVFAEIPLDAVGEMVLPSSIQNTPSVTSWGAPKEVGSGAANPGLSRGAAYTGLIIDARGLSVLPALAPRILDADGKEIYGSANVSREWAVKYGMAGYAKTPEQARAIKDRIGDNPGFLKAVRAEGAAKTDVVLTAEDALALRATAETLKYLSQARVILLVD
ncbi:MAG: hypothetical protein RL318_237 [Fibrobacterota bacterium]|jgi:hypothetical protein